MAIEILTAKIYRFVLARNADDHFVGNENLHLLGKHYGYSRGKVGYAIQLLKQKNMLRYIKRYGWKAYEI